MKNVILILSDQLRADCVGCYGNEIAKTPHIDALAAAGGRFDQTFSQHPQCAPSRASLLTGRYPHVNGSLSNHTAMGEHEVTMGEMFRQAGYRSIGVGKLHIFDHQQQRCFDEVQLSGGQNSDAITPDVLGVDYRTWLQENGYWEKALEAYAYHDTQQYWDDFQATANPIPAEAFIDTWVGDRAVETIQRQSADQPYFLFVGLPNPHMPFDCPEPYASMYDPADMPVPKSFHASLDDKPPMHAAFKRQGRRVNYETMSEAALRKAMAYYYGAVSLVDDQVGKIVAAVEARDELDNTVIAFCSDHGELLGDFGMLTKSIDEYPMLYDVGLRVPMIVRSADGAAGTVHGGLAELMDLCPTLLDAAGVAVPPEVQAVSLAPALTGNAMPVRDHVFAEAGAVKMLRGERFKLVHYPGQSYGEFYDLQDDPHEIQNLYDDPNVREVRDRMTRELLDRLIHTEAPRHGESRKGPSFWRYQYKAPFDS